MYKISFYVPQAQLEQVKLAMFAAGAGRIGHYDQCCWQVLGTGQFRPLTGSKPFVGQAQQLETLAEYLVEMVCSKAVLKAVVAALREAHPYEEPAFYIMPTLDVEGTAADQ